MSHCHDQSCSHSKNSCGCGSQSCGASGNSCSCSCHNSSKKCDAASKFLELADCAWKEVLKEKIKEHIKANAKHLDELASLIAEANHEKWKKKIENNKCCTSFEDKLNDFFGQTCDSKCQHGNQGNQNKK
jgi:hypothetical protein